MGDLATFNIVDETHETAGFQTIRVRRAFVSTFDFASGSDSGYFSFAAEFAAVCGARPGPVS
ncbi:hypothetical protein GCM10007875_20810 [Limnobacter litoralis]|uniref:Uncharacterized protein n=1 Tax=Limnobacter litoralis TaxID=481366 RepID=A0ABQ5YU59_9BURK|nr:hypothetical protein GCM10007875_20810 [Limnobacter litoralis]